MENNNTNKLIIKTVIVFVLLCTLYLTIMALFVNVGASKFSIKLLSVSSTALIYAILGGICFSIFKKDNTQQLSLIGIVIVFFGFTLNMFITLFEIESKTLTKMAISFFILSIAIAQISILYKILIVNKYAAISRTIATVAIGLFSLCIVVLIFNSFDDFKFNFYNGKFIGETMGRSLLAILAIDLGFTALTPLLNKIDEGNLDNQDLVEELLQEFPKEDVV